jgi:hypothetical protein
VEGTLKTPLHSHHFIPFIPFRPHPLPKQTVEGGKEGGRSPSTPQSPYSWAFQKCGGRMEGDFCFSLWGIYPTRKYKKRSPNRRWNFQWFSLLFSQTARSKLTFISVLSLYLSIVQRIMHLLFVCTTKIIGK